MVLNYHKIKSIAICSVHFFLKLYHFKIVVHSLPTHSVALLYFTIDQVTVYFKIIASI